MVTNLDSPQTEQEIPFAAFSSAEENSLLWYDALPGDNVRVTAVPDSFAAADLVQRLLAGIDTSSQELIDLCAAALLNNAVGDIGAEKLETLSMALSRVMADQLNRLGSRSLRMRAQRLHYYIQQYLSRLQHHDTGENVLAETMLNCAKPWDFLPCDNGAWTISSGEDNIHFTDNAGAEQCWSRGLPTQIDRVNTRFFSVGSLYSDGCDVTDGVTWEHIAHDTPIIIMWENESNQRFFLDHKSAVWRDAPRKKIRQLPCAQVHFARYHDGILYALNNGEFGHIWLYDSASGEVTHQNVMPVWVCNDIAFSDTHYYLVDKQQGHVFKFNHAWEHEAKTLSFGRGGGQLFDPVSIRYRENKLHVVSWVNGKHTELKAF